ncbi:MULTISPECIES: ammonium transporter [unclassified Marinitoga]|uniref:ammonium transporter n=1 Tax=unclassified Marinitoga TaxID=2640159 RepID=UPI000641527A|nr:MULTISPECIES: ammonium transporter [unclassified Marinitoga]KLO21680.1 ammonium transporter [Marinitoga sp. 1155]NUU99876.1 ammonium transporter [Marinitoga sp. 1154]
MFDTGNTAFMLLATSLVMLMTPGLAFFYGGLVGRKNVLTIMMQSFVSMGWTTILWVTFGFTMSFGNDILGIIGDSKYLFLHGISINTPFGANTGIPMIVFVAYQMMFAIITPALITGAFADRVKFKAYMIFLTVWLIFVYFPLVHMVWGGGLFQKWGVLDFAGGIVVHASAGAAALASVFFVGKRKQKNVKPHSIPLVALGTGLLWFGWYGFNAGSELRVDAVTANAFLNTDVAASFAAITWLILAIIFERKPKILGMLTGAVAGLATITPAAGYVTVQTSMLIGIIASIVSYAAVLYKNKKGWDDALDVWGVHGVGGYLGIVLLGLFATKSVNSNGANGLLYGNAGFFWKEFIAVTLVSIYAFIFTYIALWLINRITQVRVSGEAEIEGLDKNEFGEEAYL